MKTFKLSFEATQEAESEDEAINDFLTDVEENSNMPISVYFAENIKVEEIKKDL